VRVEVLVADTAHPQLLLHQVRIVVIFNHIIVVVFLAVFLLVISILTHKTREKIG
jgi:hypothetical protein